MKAFLSHSSKNKEFVREVARKLGRQRCIFDEQAFTTGDDIREAIESKLDSSSVFVLFLTKESLESIWVKLEIREAAYRHLYENIDSSLVYIIDNEVDFEKIPIWLRRTVITKITSPSSIATDIQHKLTEFSYSKRQKYFVGRTKDKEILEESIIPVDGSAVPNIISLIGLPGIGRRTLIKNFSEQLLELKKHAEIKIESGDNLNDICAKLADLIEPYGTHEELKNIIEGILALEIDFALKRSVSNLSRLINNNQLPIFVDEGGLLKEDGRLNSGLEMILKSIPSDVYVCLITHRKIYNYNSESIVSHKVKPLTNIETKRLIKKISKDCENVNLTTAELSEVSEYVNGYPPAAYFTVEQCSEYGKDLVLSDKFTLVNFSSTRFAKFLKKSLINTDQIKILKLLSTYSPLPLSAIAEYISKDPKNTHDSMYELMDKSLAVVDTNSLYSISKPIKDSIRKEFGLLSIKRLNIVCSELIDYIRNTDYSEKLELSRVLFRIASIAGDDNAVSEAIHLRNDYIKLVETSYHDRLYEKSIKFGSLAIEECPDSIVARSYLVRSYIQEEKWTAAIEQLEELKKYAEPRDVYFLVGFMERKRSRFSDAIDALMNSKKEGKGGSAISREIAHCYLLMHQNDEAAVYIADAMKKQPDNPHILDLAAKIYIKISKFEDTKNILDKMCLIDDSEHYSLRASCYYYCLEDYQQAIKFAKTSILQSSKYFFSARVQLIKSLIKNNDIEQAEIEISKLDNDFTGRKNNIRVALRISIYLKSNKNKDAYLTCEKFNDKQSSQYESTRTVCLKRLSQDVSVEYELRKKYSGEINTISDDDVDMLDAIEEL